jgi:hypothetical protein
MDWKKFMNINEDTVTVQDKRFSFDASIALLTMFFLLLYYFLMFIVMKKSFLLYDVHHIFLSE